MRAHLVQLENNKPYNIEQSTDHSFCPHNSSQDFDTLVLYLVNESPVTTHPTQFPGNNIDAVAIPTQLTWFKHANTMAVAYLEAAKN